MILRDPKKSEADKPAPPVKAATRKVDVAASKEIGPGAVVLITPAAATALAGKNPQVHVLLHYYGHTGGYGDPGASARDAQSGIRLAGRSKPPDAR